MLPRMLRQAIVRACQIFCRPFSQHCLTTKPARLHAFAPSCAPRLRRPPRATASRPTVPVCERCSVASMRYSPGWTRICIVLCSQRALAPSVSSRFAWRSCICAASLALRARAACGSACGRTTGSAHSTRRSEPTVVVLLLARTARLRSSTQRQRLSLSSCTCSRRSSCGGGGSFSMRRAQTRWCDCSATPRAASAMPCCRSCLGSAPC
mmetsp:Transcript_13687/g.57196  ORF Transcript_13687/g.57196 Transcript_13687/m.57196 type:complete len:209 (-) Transcript_13687:2858-3484(-)